MIWPVLNLSSTVLVHLYCLLMRITSSFPSLPIPLTVAGRKLTPDAAVITVSFESGCEKFQSLERGIFVGAGRFVIDERGLTSEYKVSQVGSE